LADRGTEFFNRKAKIVKKTRLDSSGSYQQNNASAVETSYLVAQRIVKVNKTAHNSRRINSSMC
jgi:hypothetical protein